MAGLICHSGPSTQPAELSEKSSEKRTTCATFWTPVIGSHASSVQMLLSFGSIVLCVTPIIGSHASAVHALLSLMLTCVWLTPVTGSHASSVQTLLSLMFT